jgi:hypothetical protein
VLTPVRGGEISAHYKHDGFAVFFYADADSKKKLYSPQKNLGNGIYALQGIKCLCALYDEKLAGNSSIASVL